MKAPDVNIEELEKLKQKNFQERLDFIDRYTKWLKKTENQKWSSQQKNFSD